MGMNAKNRNVKQSTMQQLFASKTRLPIFSGKWTELNMARHSVVKARIGWQGLTTAEYLSTGEYYLVTGTDFLGDRVDWTNCCFVDRARFVQDKNIQLETNDVLLTKDGTIGKAGFVDRLPGPATLNSGVFVIRPKAESYSPKYIYYVLTSHIFEDFLVRLQAGSTISHLYQKDFTEFTFRAPNKNEQIAIAEVLSDMDGLLEAFEALIAKKRNIKQATMQQLLTGKTRLPGFSRRWKMTQLGEMGICLRGVSYDPASDLSPCDTGSTVRLLRSNNILDSVINKHDVQFVESRRVSESQIMLLDDVLICMANGSKDLVGKTGLFREADGHTYTFGAFMGCFRTEQSISNPVFVYYLFNTYQFRNFVGVVLAGSSINNLKSSDIESAEFRIPNLEEQNVIATILSDMDAEIAVQERRRDKIRAIKKGMMQQLLTGRIRLVESK